MTETCACWERVYGVLCVTYHDQHLPFTILAIFLMIRHMHAFVVISDIIITHCKWHVRVVQLLLLVNTLICEWKRSKSEINCTNRQQHNSHQHNSTSIWQDNSRQMPAPLLKVHRVFVFWLCCNTLTLTSCTCTCIRSTITWSMPMCDAVNGMFGVMTQFAYLNLN